MLAQSIEEEKQIREFQVLQMKESWEDAARRRADLNAQPAPLDFDHTNCGPAAALKFSGEDTSRQDRVRQQKEQMRKVRSSYLPPSVHHMTLSLSV
jgi:hypothetical protein